MGAKTECDATWRPRRADDHIDADNRGKKNRSLGRCGNPPAHGKGIDRCDGATPRAAGRTRLLSDATLGNACALPACVAGNWYQHD